jgi:hypothetical protein
MNNDQLNSLIRTALKIIGGLLLKHGLTAEADWLNSADALGAFTLVVGLLWSHFHHDSADSPQPPQPPGGGKLLLLILAAGLLACAGCTCFTVSQKDESPNERIITSTIRATAWFSSAQAIAGIKAIQTDQTQSFGTDRLNQQGATNTAATLDALARLLTALPKP